MNYIKQIIGFSLGVIITLLMVYFFKNFGKDEANTDYYILTNQISKMNKTGYIEKDLLNIIKK